MTLVIASVFIATLLLTYGGYCYALKKKLLDVPNYRREHARITPRGGGIGFVISVTASLWLFSSWHWISTYSAWSLIIASLLIAGIGYIDDHNEVSPLLKFIIHILASAIVVTGLTLPDTFQLTRFFALSGWLLTAVISIGLIYMTNIYNFMDGIDGIVAVQVISTCGLMFAGLTYTHQLFPQAWLLLILMVAMFAFLVFNWPPAKIFMGDVGSNFTGLMMGILGLLLWCHDERLLWCWLILQGVFIVDATITLLRRNWRGKTLYLAHNSHAYHHIFRRYQNVVIIISCIGVINVLWLGSWAWLVWTLTTTPLLAVFISYTPLIILAYYFKAGINGIDELQEIKNH